MDCWEVNTDVFGTIGVIKNCSYQKFLEYLQLLSEKGIQIKSIKNL